jgi:hypothetical protein
MKVRASRRRQFFVIRKGALDSYRMTLRPALELAVWIGEIMSPLAASGLGHSLTLFRRAVCCLVVAALTVCLIAPAPAQTAVDLQLVLALDVSGSVNQARFELQKQGYAAAFRNPQVLEAIRSGVNKGIAVTMVQWSDPMIQTQVVPWTIISDERSAEAFAAAVENTQREPFSGSTSISGAIDYSVMLLLKSPYAGSRKVIDVSGDGANNRGRPAAEARDDAVRAGIVINGLPILALESDLAHYYWDNVIGGPGAFIVVAESFETFGDAILRKLVAEVAANER